MNAAHRLVELTGHNDPGGAAAASRAGLRMAPTSQLLWRDLLNTGPSDPDGPGTAALVEELLVTLHNGRIAMEPETEALIAELIPVHEAGHPA